MTTIYKLHILQPLYLVILPLDIVVSICYNIDTVKDRGVIKLKAKKKTAEILTEIDSNLDKVLSILTKLALAAMSFKTILEILLPK